MDAHANFAYSTVATAPSPATSGTSLVLAAATGTRFPAVPFNATIWPSNVLPLAANAEIVRVTAISTDTLTIVRAQEGTAAQTIGVGDQIAATVTAKTLTDIEPKTRVAGYSFGGTDGNYTYANAEAYAVRVPISLSKSATRIRFWFDTNRDSSPATTTGSLVITNVYLGVEDPANEGSYLSTPTLVSASPGTAAYNSRAVTPYFDLVAAGWNQPGLSLLMSYVVTSTGSNATGNSNGSNGWVSTTVASVNSTALTAPFRAPSQVRTGADWEYIDDGSQVGLFIGPSFVDSGGQASSLTGFRGQDSGWPQRWARKTGNVAVCLSLSSALSSRYTSSTDAIYSKFPNVKPDFILVSVACGNDIIQGASLATAQTSFRSVLSALRTKFPGVPIHTTTEMPYGPGFISGPTSGIETIRQQFNAWLGTLGPFLVASVTDFDAGTIDLQSSASSTSFTSVTLTDTGDIVTITGHGAVVNDIIEFDTITSTTGLLAGVPYYVLTVPSTSTMTISATKGGSTLALTTNGSAARATITKAPQTWKMPAKNTAADLSHPSPYGSMVLAGLLAARFLGRIPQ